jgi:hypothetical protein
MLRKVIALVRGFVIGPNLARITGLNQAELNNLMLYASSDPIISAIRAPSVQGQTQHTKVGESGCMESCEAIREELKVLTHQQTVLEERIAVLERILYRQTKFD